MALVVLDGFRVLVVHTGHDVTAGAIEYYQVVDIRAGSRFILSNSAVVDRTDRTFTGTHHAIADGVDGFDHSSAQSRFRAAAVLGGDLHLLTRQGIKRFR